MNHRTMATPLPPDINWESLIKWIGACVSGLFGFTIGVDRYFKYLRVQKAEAAKLVRIEKEEFIKSVVNSAVTVAIAEVHDDVKELKKNRESDMKYFQKMITDFYRANK